MTDDSKEWGPWIEHDGKGCPCRGQIVTSVQRNGTTRIHMAESIVVKGDNIIRFGKVKNSRWVWSDVKVEHQIIRYCIRKPRALRQLIEMVENLPEPSKQGERVK